MATKTQKKTTTTKKNKVTKKTRKKKAVTKKEDLLIELNEVYLTNNERQTLLLLDSRIKNAELVGRVKKLEIAEQKRQAIEHIKNLDASLETTLRSLAQDKTEAKAELEQIKSQIEEKYNIKLAECTFDEHTGRIKELPDD